MGNLLKEQHLIRTASSGKKITNDTLVVKRGDSVFVNISITFKLLVLSL